jgi:D-alanine transaminase
LLYYNGTWLSSVEIPSDDRSFHFGDGLYEVIRVYQGKPYGMAAHLARLGRGASAVEMPLQLEAVKAIVLESIRRNGLYEGHVYLQVSRSAGNGRKHSFFALDAEPRLFVQCVASEYRELRQKQTEGVAAILEEDLRWARRDIKSVNLLPNCIAKSHADRAGAFEAILHENGNVTEGSHTNVFAVRNGELFTHPTNFRILAGVTRARVIQLAADLGIATREVVVPVSQLMSADEVFLTGTTTEILGVTRIDARRIGDGKVGAVTQRLLDCFHQDTRTFSVL